jgi:hypothetical protein
MAIHMNNPCLVSYPVEIHTARDPQCELFPKHVCYISELNAFAVFVLGCLFAIEATYEEAIHAALSWSEILLDHSSPMLYEHTVRELALGAQGEIQIAHPDIFPKRLDMYLAQELAHTSAVLTGMLTAHENAQNANGISEYIVGTTISVYEQKITMLNTMLDKWRKHEQEWQERAQRYEYEYYETMAEEDAESVLYT